MKRFFLAILAFGLCIPALTAFADTLELKNGSVIRGTFIGGSEAQITFRVGSSLQHYPVNDVVSIRFETDSSNSSYGNYPPQPQSSYSPPQPQSGYNPPPSNYPPPPGQPNDSQSAQQQNYPEQNNSRQDYSQAPPPPPVADSSQISGNSVTVPSGTRLTIRTIDAIDSSRSHVGDRFAASLDQPLYVNDVLVAPRGANVYGRLEQVQESGQLSGRTQLRLSLIGIVVNGQMYPITTGDYQLSGKSRSTGTAAKVGGGAVLGALIGAAVGGGKGAAVGAGVGAGAGTAAQIATKGDQIHVPSETILEFTIDQPVTLPAQAY